MLEVVLLVVMLSCALLAVLILLVKPVALRSHTIQQQEPESRCITTSTHTTPCVHRSTHMFHPAPYFYHLLTSRAPELLVLVGTEVPIGAHRIEEVSELAPPRRRLARLLRPLRSAVLA